MKKHKLLLGFLMAAGMSMPPAHAQQADEVASAAVPAQDANGQSELGAAADGKVEIAKQLANPIANMVSVPFQWNWDQGVGQNKQGHDQSLLVQPVIPFGLSGGDAFIARPIITSSWQSDVNGFTGYGLNSVQLETFYAPNTGSSLIWGVGPYFASPGGMSGHFGSQQTGGGVTGVVLDRTGSWTYGLLAFNSWSLGGSAISGTQNNLFYQPFVAYVTADSWTYSLNMQSTYNYDAHRTQNPINAMLSKLVMTYGLPISYEIGARYNLTSIPGGATGWGARAAITFVFPK